MDMQLFLDIVFQFSIFAVNILLPLSLALVIIGSAIMNKSVLKNAFFSGLGVILLYLVIFGLQIKQIYEAGAPLAEVFGNTEGILGVIFTIVLPIVIGVVVMIVSQRRFKGLGTV